MAHFVVLCVSCAMRAGKIAKKIASKASSAYYRTKWKLEDTFKGKNPVRKFMAKRRMAKMPPPVRAAVTSSTPSAVQKAAIENVRQLQKKVPTLPKRQPPPITTPSPASMKLKGPSRPPPPPPSNIPSRPTMATPKIVPRVPMKPSALRGRSLK